MADQTINAVEEAPSGIAIRREGRDFEIVATMRSLATPFFIIFALVWVCGAGGFFALLFSIMGIDIIPILFAIPFLVASIIASTLALLLTVGTVRVGARQGQGWVSVGVGPLARTRRFSWAEIEGITEQPSGIKVNGQRRPEIVLQGPRPLGFGSILSDRRRVFVLETLQQLQVAAR